MNFNHLRHLALIVVGVLLVPTVRAAYLEWQVAPMFSVEQSENDSTYGEVEWASGEESAEDGASAMPLQRGDIYFAEVLDYALSQAGLAQRGRVNVAAALHVVPKSYLDVWHGASAVPEPTGASLVALAAALLALRRRCGFGETVR